MRETHAMKRPHLRTVFSMGLGLAMGCCVLADEREEPLAAQVVRQQELLLHDAHDTKEFEDIDSILVTIYTVEGSTVELSSELRRRLVEAADGLDPEPEQALAAPRPLHHWLLLGEDDQPLCLLSLYLNNHFAFCGVERVGVGVYQARNVERWSKTFDAYDILDMLLDETGVRYFSDVKMGVESLDGGEQKEQKGPGLDQ